MSNRGMRRDDSTVPEAGDRSERLIDRNLVEFGETGMLSKTCVTRLAHKRRISIKYICLRRLVHGPQENV